MKKQILLTLLYYLFVIIAIATIIPLVAYWLGYKTVWEYYAAGYFISIIIYVWYRFTLLAYQDIRAKKPEKDYISNFSVIIPCYNEEAELLTKCVESVINAEGNKEVILIDDGSENNVWETMQALKLRFPGIIRAFRYKHNHGKRTALHYAFKNINTEFVITIDSDTIIEKEAFTYLLGPLKEKRVGATTGNIELINEKKNFLTRIIAGLYLSGLDNYKRAQNVRGDVICCSGCLSAYRTTLLKELADSFLNQRFLGKKAAHSEDRHLTNLILEKGYRVHYVKEAMCYTETPDTLKQFLKQQMRWRRGFVRESIYLISFSWKRPTLFLESTLGSMIPFYLSFGIQIFILSMLFIHPSYILFMIPVWIIAMTMRELPIFLEKPGKAAWFYFYIPLYDLLICWQNIYAVFTVNNKNWLTRKIAKKKKISYFEDNDLDDLMVDIKNKILGRKPQNLNNSSSTLNLWQETKTFGN